MSDCTLRYGEWAPQVTPRDPESAQKTAATCALGLAILSSICRSQQLAQSQDMIEKAPLFAKVRSDVCTLKGEERGRFTRLRTY